ncbi:tRNA (guanosine(37)-N1)-methyltransferase TrmD [Chitinispirillales bacterium ANBcel5]|uniref:tRNA (guanosine(37)-N1)-methyltransferase TrmD n=1 Tax=Cellulosispirillum alkaliphilum TaxID=3039283 RepID=UPI002A4E9AE6|nr:tRNA (guanosine(37)-N1)-methyltransferase TrmD [Chitinispirillales bacterium ANBcel5]
MFFDILTLFPAMFEGVFCDSIIKRAVDKGFISIDIHNIRDYSHDEKHHTVDDYPYGGDAGMLMRPEPLADAIKDSKERLKGHNPTVVYMSPAGEPLNQSVVNSFLSDKALILLCGRYKGIDQRIIDHYVDREISIGDYVLSGGEIPAMVLLDSITRLIPGVLGNRESAEADSFYSGMLSYPQYTRPEIFEQMSVPDVLLSGHHAKIKQWQEMMAQKITQHRRPDLLKEKENKHNNSI